MNKKITAIIPARGGSKGIPRKNLYPINGKPLIQYTIEAAKNSHYLDQIVLNSEDEEIRHFCSDLGVDASYKRPYSLAGDQSRLVDSVVEWLDWMEVNHDLPDVIVLLQPTSPLRTAELIDSAIEAFLNKPAVSLVGVTEMKEHPAKSIFVEKDSWRYIVDSGAYVPRRQELEKNYFTINGAIYIATPEWLRNYNDFTVQGKTQLFETPHDQAVDVDAMIDVHIVEAILNAKTIKYE
ncbi:cytidylyltransferase domain-containing protein [Thiomicrospira sp. ALE5]|uniref:acylneuraminate cytidylyltransferase family protein n=1 Tax=Thiomicrospira sp. ALE5 TaxID=748650 RepID=UPI0008E166F4|nr:acylneuraminate cytidylyltransferase family protein [Thiomicrospira sp. ALE5]SFR59375.1 N-acylneuraminate cytidylyltransferase [Thiomicrospira sp. ALE5]